MKNIEYSSESSQTSSLSVSDRLAEFLNEDFCFEGDTYNISKAEDCPSEDAFFSTPKGVGISDGVGGWNNYGIDSYRFSNTLMQECQNLINKVIMYK